MYALRFRLARWVLAHRKLAWGFFAAVTLFFMAGLPRVELETIFADLLPADDPGEFTEVIYDDIAFGVDLDEAFFSLNQLKR